MFRLDAELLEELGLGGLRPDLANLALRTMYDLLEDAVGRQLALRMTAAQMDSFGYLTDIDDPAAAAEFLSSALPDYESVVGDELERLKDQIRSESGAVMEAVSSALEAAGGSLPPA